MSFKFCCCHYSQKSAKFDTIVSKLNEFNVTVQKRHVTRKVASDQRRGRFGDCSGIIGFTHIKKKNNSLLALLRGTGRDSLQTSDQWTKKKQKRLSFSSGDGLENRFGLL